MKPNQKNEAVHVIIQRLLATDRLKVMEDYRFLTRNIKQLMTMAGISQLEMAKMLEIDKAKLTRRFDNPDLWRASEMEKALRIIDKKLR